MFPVVFSFNNKPFSISRPVIHDKQGDWLVLWNCNNQRSRLRLGSGNTMIKLENYTYGNEKIVIIQAEYTATWGRYYPKWTGSGIIVYLRGRNYLLYRDGVVQRNDATLYWQLWKPVKPFSHYNN